MNTRKENYSQACRKLRHATGSGWNLFRPVCFCLCNLPMSFVSGGLVHSGSVRKEEHHFLQRIGVKVMCDRTLNSHNQYQAIRQDAPLIKAGGWQQWNRTWAVNERVHTGKVGNQKACFQAFMRQQLWSTHKRALWESESNNSCNHIQ